MVYSAQWNGVAWVNVDAILNDVDTFMSNTIKYLKDELKKLYVNALIYKATCKESELPIVSIPEESALQKGWFYYISEYDITRLEF